MGVIIEIPNTGTGSSTATGSGTTINVEDTNPEVGKYAINVLFNDGYLLRLGIYNGPDKLIKANYTIIDDLDPN